MVIDDRKYIKIIILEDRKVSKSVKDFFSLSLPKGDLYKRRKKQPIKSEDIFFLILFFALVFLVSLKFYTILKADVPRELREANMAILAYDFANGVNPYSIDRLNDLMPMATSLYGFVVPLLLSPFVRAGEFFGIGVLRICQIVTLLIESVGLFFGYKLVIYKMNKLYAIGVTILLYSCYWRYDACGGAFPDQWGVTLLIILAYMIYYGQKEVYRPKLYAIIMVVLFFIKSYFVFATFGVALFLWIHSKKDCIRFIISGIICGVGSFICVGIVFPLYFSMILPIGAGTTFNCGFLFSVKQLFEMSCRFYGLLLIVIMAYIVSLLFPRKCKNKNRKVIDACYKLTSSFSFCEILCILPLVIVIARNGGTYYTYYLQLLFPWIILFSAEALMGIIELKQTYTREYFNTQIIVGVIFSISIVMCRNLIVSTPLNASEIADWKQVYSMLDRYTAEGDILVSAHLASYCIDNKIPTAEYGQQEFNNSTNLRSYESKKWQQKIFPMADDILLMNVNYNDEVKQNIKSKKYSCVMITDATKYELDEDFLFEAGYSILDERMLITGTELWNTKIYVP